MVVRNSSQESGGDETITIKPNQSLTWSQTKRLLLLFLCVFLAVAGYFWQLGAWMVVPFLGAELALLAGAFYVHSLHSARGETIEFDGERVWFRTRAGRTGFPRAWLQVRLLKSPVGDRPNRLIVGAHGRFMQVGTFLHDRERERLASMVERAAAQRLQHAR